jgi:4-hydroxy-tetrahydrodipicolinate synthase
MYRNEKEGNRLEHPGVLKTKQLDGIIGALLTPFNRSGAIDYGALKAEIDFTIDDCGADSVSLGAVEASEYGLLGIDERKELIRRGVEMVAGRVPVIAGVSSHSVKTAGELSKFSAGCGADFVQALVQHLPWGGQPEPDEVLNYFQRLGEESPLPIVAYLFAGPGADLGIPATVLLAQQPMVCAFKESSRDLKRIGRLIEEINRAGHARYFTTMEMLLTTLMMGGPGATMPPPAIKIAKFILEEHRNGNMDNAVSGQRVFSLLGSRFGARGLVPLMKGALKIVGLDIGGPHDPYRSLNGDEEAALSKFFKGNALLGKLFGVS